jgi:hypothetical protein
MTSADKKQISNAFRKAVEMVCQYDKAKKEYRVLPEFSKPSQQAELLLAIANLFNRNLEAI